MAGRTATGVDGENVTHRSYHDTPNTIMHVYPSIEDSIDDDSLNIPISKWCKNRYEFSILW